MPNDELFGIIYTIDDGDDWTDPAVLRKANPNMGFLSAVITCYLNSARQLTTHEKWACSNTKHLNIWVAAKDAFFNLVNWQKCEDRSLTLERFEGIPAFWRLTLRESWI
ncbi:terminase large subunit [Escherichia coli]|nr:terminase large subunit [Escherichia coli]